MKKTTILIFIIAFQNTLYAQINDSLLKPSLKLDLALIDIPYQIDAGKTVNNGKLTFGSFLKGYANPSMAQSLSLTTDLYSSAHFGIDKLFKVQKKYLDTKYKFFHISSLFISDFVLTYAPGGDGWLHEEYHRAVMTRYHVNSFDDMNTFPIGADMVSVNHIIDEDLVRFKRESPYDFIRMHVAGIEGEYLLIDKLQANNFFYHQNISHEILYLLITTNSISYVSASSIPEFVDIDTDEMNNKEIGILDRDFTGYDFSAWAYDLFNPNEPYENRGIHPSGTGIDRYIKTTDLSSDALKYLKKKGKQQWLNIISPMLFWKKSIHLKNDYYFNFAVRHFLTSFGDDISLNVFLQTRNSNLIFRYHHANNYNKNFPSIEAELFEKPFGFLELDFLLSPRIIAGFQPKNQSFFTEESEFLGYAGCRIDWVSNWVHPWVELSAKTDGWIAGNEFLNNNFSVKIGLSTRFK